MLSRRSALRRYPPLLVSAVGFALMLAANFAAPERMPLRARPFGVWVPLPDWVIINTVAGLCVASLAFIAMSFPRPRRRRKKGEEEYEMYREPQRTPPVVVALLLLLALTPGAILAGSIVWLGRTNVSVIPEYSATVRGRAPTPVGQASSPGHKEGLVHRASNVTSGLAGALALLVGFGSFGVVAWLFFRSRLRATPVGGDVDQPLANAVDASLNDLSREPDARIAIIRIYANFEQALAIAGLPRQRWETPAEFMRAALGRIALPQGATTTLTRLFERARFSAHPLGGTERDSAWRCLMTIREALESRRKLSDAAA